MASTDLRAAAQQALTALQTLKDRGVWGDFDGVADALRAALVEDAMQDQQLRDDAARWKNIRGYVEEMEREIQALRAALAEPVQDGCDHCNHPLYAAIKCRVCGRVTEPVQEPVAWIHTDPDNLRVKFLVWRENEPAYRGVWIKTPLFTAPPQRTLTDEVIANLWHQNGGFHHHFARAIERWLKCNP